MVQSRTKIFISIGLIALFFGCYSCTDNSFFTIKGKILREQKTAFDISYKKKKLLCHFPDKKGRSCISFRASPPTCPPKFDCLKQSGYYYQIYQLDTTINKPNDILYACRYSNDNNIIIDFTELKKDVFRVEKCNQWFENKYPIPYFEGFNFELGYRSEDTIIDNVLHINVVHTIPSDLEVYVLEAEAGNFWKELCNEKRPESLKKWKNGYSKGIAISKKENIVMYWTIVW